MKTHLLAAALVAAVGSPAAAQPADPVATAARALQPKVVAWRRDIHRHPELGNRETRTAKLVAEHLRKLGMEVRTGIGKTGVVGILKGGQPGRVVALRADMDALPVEEKTGLPFASKATSTYMGRTVPVMHACGHDSHVAMLMGAAELLAGMRRDIPGTVMFVFQPAEEGPPPGEKGGASLMMEEGVFKDPTPSAVFGMHVMPGDAGKFYYRPEGFYASAERIEIKLKGRQTHGARPWSGIDVVALGADVVGAVNQIAARQIDVSDTPTVITIATMNAGVRHNIIPEEMVMTGTLRTFSKERRDDVVQRVTRAVTKLAESYGATGEVSFNDPYPVTYNDPALSKAVLPSLVKAAGGEAMVDADAQVVTGSEDFPQFTRNIPGVYVQLGARPAGLDPKTAPVNHSPFFDIDERAMEAGVRAHAHLALDYLRSAAAR